MKRQNRLKIRISKVAYVRLLVGLALAGTAQAQTLTWDANTGTTGAQAGVGVWDTTTANWWHSTANVNVIWDDFNNDGSPDNNGAVRFPAGSSTVTLTEDITISQMWYVPSTVTINSQDGAKLIFAQTSLTPGIWQQWSADGLGPSINAPVELQNSVTVNGLYATRFNGPVTTSGGSTGGRFSVGLSALIQLNASNNFVRGLVVSSGWIQLGHDSALGVPDPNATPSFDVPNTVAFGNGSGGTFLAVNGARVIPAHLFMNVQNHTVVLTGTNRLEFSGKFVLPSDSTTATLRTDNTADTVFSGVISRANGKITKTGSGRLIFSGNNTYSGTTAVSNGTLLVNGATMGQGDYTVAAGATLGGTGTVGLASGKSLTVTGTLCPGSATNAPGTLTVSGAATLAENSVYQWAYASGSSSLLNVTGALTLPTVATVTVSLVSGSLPKSAVICSANSLAGAGDLSGWVVTGADAGACAAVEGTTVKLMRLTPAGGTVVCVH